MRDARLHNRLVFCCDSAFTPILRGKAQRSLLLLHDEARRYPLSLLGETRGRPSLSLEKRCRALQGPKFGPYIAPGAFHVRFNTDYFESLLAG